jgi:hypothetical protein
MQKSYRRLSLALSSHSKAAELRNFSFETDEPLFVHRSPPVVLPQDNLSGGMALSRRGRDCRRREQERNQFPQQKRVRHLSTQKR